MRTLTSVRSATSVLLDMEFRVKASDASTTFLFPSADIVTYPKIDWEIDYQGGMGKASNYRITLASSIGFLAENRNKLIKGQTFVKVFVNSDNFTPHVGRVRGIERDANNPNIYDLVVYDDFLDGNPKIPIESIVDSYTVVHPEVIGADMGYPLYYGKHTRPFYMTPVDCDIKVLFGPRNVSSENHVSSVFYNHDSSTFRDITDLNVYLLGQSWTQQSGSTNQVSGSYHFELNEKHRLNTGLFKWENSLADDVSKIASESNISLAYGKRIIGNGLHSTTDQNDFNPYITNNIIPAELIHNITRLSLSSVIDNYNFGTHTVRFRISSGTGPINSQISQVGSMTLIASSDVASTAAANPGNAKYLLRNQRQYLEITAASGSESSNVSTTCSLDLSLSLKSEAYRNYSIYAMQVNCSDIAITENPNKIIENLINSTSFNYVTAQNSQAQTDTQSFDMQCFFGERQSLSDIMDDFGKTVATYYWMGDSGYINFRTYAESSTVQASIDYTITTSDVVANSLRIKDNPIGSIFYQSKKAKRLKFDYDYNFASGKYDQSITVDKSNNPFCNSADAANIQKELTFKTKYIKETSVMSYYVMNAVRRHVTLNDTILEGELPPRFLGMEITDINRVKHLSLLNSDSLFQITKISPDYETGFTKFTANEIVNL